MGGGASAAIPVSLPDRRGVFKGVATDDHLRPSERLTGRRNVLGSAQGYWRAEFRPAIPAVPVRHVSQIVSLSLESAPVLLRILQDTTILLERNTAADPLTLLLRQWLVLQLHVVPAAVRFYTSSTAATTLL